MADDDNFYDLLELDPTVSDPSAIEAALAKKKKRWDNDSAQGAPNARRKAERNLLRLAEIRGTLLDPATRRAHAEQALNLRKSKRAAAFKCLDEALAMMRVAHQPATRETIRQLAQNKAIAGILSEDEVSRHIRDAGMLEATGTTPAPPRSRAPQLDPSKMKSLREHLDSLTKTDLYQLLELSPHSSLESLRNKADEKNREILRRGTTGPEATALKTLYGACLELFNSSENKLKYDFSLATERMLKLDLSIRMAGTDKFLSVEEQDLLVRQAGDLGVPEELALAYLEDLATTQKWGFQRRGAGAGPTLRRCPHCHQAVADAAARHCTNCSQPLSATCWRCSKTVAVEHAACPGCGLHLGDAPEVERLLRAAKEHAASAAHAAAEEALRRALDLWPKWPPAEQLLREVSAGVQAKAEAARRFDQLLSARKFVAAETLLRQQGSAPELQAVAERVRDALLRARKLAAEGDRQRSAGATDAAIRHYESALEVCADLAEARAPLEALPPSPPQALTATALRSGFRLSWRASSETNVRYVIVRRSEGYPQHVRDGSKLGESHAVQFDDVSAPNGVPIYYAVFACRGDIASKASAATGPLLVPADVTGAEALPAGNEVLLRWQQPPGSLRVEVWRKDRGAPASRGGGTLLPFSAGALHDTNVVLGSTYGYLLVAVYPDPNRAGSELFAPGVPLMATPVRPPNSVVDLRAQRSGTRVGLTWTPAADATVQLRRSSTIPSAPVGSVLPLASLASFGELVAAHAPGTAESVVDTQGQVVFVPFTVAGGIAVVGRAITLTMLDDVSGLRSQTNGRDIVLTWSWPQGANQVQVSYATDRYPERANDPNATSYVVDRNAYTRTNGFELRNLKPARYYICVFVRGGADLWSEGARVLEPMGQSTIVHYRVKVKKGGLLNRSLVAVWIELVSDPSLSALERLIVRAKDGQPPLGAVDGRVLVEVPALHFEKGNARIDIPLASASPTAYAKLFFRDGAFARDVRLMPASNAELRLG